MHHECSGDDSAVDTMTEAPPAHGSGDSLLAGILRELYERTEAAD